ANGVLALYQLIQKEITLLEHWKTSSDMLTTVQDCTDHETISFIVGGATGVLSRVRSKLPQIESNCQDLSRLDLFHDHELIEDSITECQHPIWFIQTYQLYHGDICDNLVFIGSEDSKWRV